MKKLLAPLLLGFGMALALMIGRRMSTDAMAVVIGVVVGVASSVPTSLLLVALLRRERAMPLAAGADRAAPALVPQPATPQFVVLNASDLMGARQDASQMPMPPVGLVQDGGLRRLRVVGDDDEWS